MCIRDRYWDVNARFQALNAKGKKMTCEARLISLDGEKAQSGNEKDALEHPRPIDMARVDAQQARRALDRLVGYKSSPLLWAKVKKGLSAGRVQSVATRRVVEREQSI